MNRRWKGILTRAVVAMRTQLNYSDSLAELEDELERIERAIEREDREIDPSKNPRWVRVR